MQTRQEILKRYVFLFGGLIINAFGVVLITKSALGTSPIASIPYVLSEAFPLSLGMFTFFLYAIFFLIQMLLLGKELRKRDFIQIPLSVIYAVFIDICVSLVDGITPGSYFMKLSWLIVGCMFRAMGVSMQVTADVAMLSGEAFMALLARKLKKDFSVIKMLCDGGMVVVAVILSFLFFSRLYGIGEGTLISVIITAPITKLFNMLLSPCIRTFRIDNSAYAIKKLDKSDKESFIITISSQSGSGGHWIARILSERLDMPLYDDSLVAEVAKEGDLSEEYVSERIEKLYSNRFLEFFSESYSFFNSSGSSLKPETCEPLFEAQNKAIKRLAEKGSCILVGHCSEYILSDRSNVFSIYIHANESAKQRFIEKEYHVTSDKALKIMQEHDHDRSVYFKHFTGENWDSSDRYSLSIDSSTLGIEETAFAICDIIKRNLK